MRSLRLAICSAARSVRLLSDVRPQKPTDRLGVHSLACRRSEGRWLVSQSGHAGHGMMWIEGDLQTTKANLAPRCRR